MDITRATITCLAVALAGCAGTSRANGSDVGPNPTLTKPDRKIIPTVNVAPAKPWLLGEKPVAANGLKVNAFAAGLDHPRWVYVLPNGDVLVAESNAPKRPEDGKGVKAKAMQLFKKKAGAGTPSANRITLLRDVDGDGVAETKSAFLENLNSPFGMALVGDRLYIANTDAIVSVPYTAGDTQITAPPTRLVELPAGPRNHHWTKALIANKDGSKLYATVGSNSNIAENTLAAEDGRAAIWEIDTRTGAKRLFATGLRNPNGMGWEPTTGALWTVVNERDELGNDLVPDYLTSVKDGAFYGWPWSYYGQHVDERVKPPNPNMVAKAIKPDYALGSHVAPLGMTFAQDAKLGSGYSSGAFVGQHGSWNRKPHSGYNVVYVPFAGGKPAGMPVEVLGGFLNTKGEAQGRPVGVAIDKRGALLVADDVGNVIWRVSGAS